MRKMTILIIEDEQAIRELLQFALEPAGFAIINAESAMAARLKLANVIPDLILLDWMLPGISGIEYIKELRHNEKTHQLPVIMLTAKAEESNKVKGLECGADDYIIKPFSPRELIARIKSVLRRGLLSSPAGVIKLRHLSLNIYTHELTIDEQALVLSPTEYRLLHFFMTHPNRVYSRQQLLDYIWTEQLSISERTVDVQIKRLRQRLKRDGHAQLIHTVHGVGYQLQIPK